MNAVRYIAIFIAGVCFALVGVLMLLMVYGIFIDKSDAAQPLTVAQSRETIEALAAVEPTHTPLTIAAVTPTTLPTETPSPTELSGTENALPTPTGPVLAVTSISTSIPSLDPEQSTSDSAAALEDNGVQQVEEITGSAPSDIPVSPSVAGSISIEELKARATSYDIRELTRNTENYVGHVVTYYGRVLQVLEDKALFDDRVTYTLRFAVDGNYDNVIAAKLVYEDGQGFRPLEDDRLTIWGTVEGREKYLTVLNAEVTLPAVLIHHLETESEQAVAGTAVGTGSGIDSSPPKLEVLSHTTYGSSGYFYIIGEVQNQSDYPVQSVKIVATLRDSNGNVVDTDYSYSRLDTILVNGKSPFSISFSSWEGVSTYDLAVEGRRGELPRQDLIILSHGSSVDGSSLRVFGEVQNTGTAPAEYVKLIITLYSSNGQVIGSDYTYSTLDTVVPGGTSAFSASISRWEGFSYYEIQVEGR